MIPVSPYGQLATTSQNMDVEFCQKLKISIESVTQNCIEMVTTDWRHKNDSVCELGPWKWTTIGFRKVQLIFSGTGRVSKEKYSRPEN